MFSLSIASRFPTESTIITTDKTLRSADHLKYSVVTLSCLPILCFTAVCCSCVPPTVVATDTGDKTFDCALVSVLVKYSGPLENGLSLLLYALS